MNYRGYLMQMAQRGKVIKTGGTLIILNKQPYTKRSFSGSSGVYSGGTIKKLILDRLDNGIEPLTTSVSTLTIGKKYRKKSSKKASKKASRGGSLNPAADFISAIVKGSKKLSKRKSSKRKSSKRKSSKRKSSKRKSSKRKASKRKSSKKSGGRVARKKRSFKALKFKM
jgi:hypothetical protein